MKRLLPIILSLLITVFSFTVIFTPVVNAQVNQDQLENTDENWIVDDEVTAIGKNAARSGLLLDWALKDYNWSFTSPGTQNPLLPFWITLRNIVYAFLIAVVMIAAIVMLVTRGKSLTIQRFIPRFIIIVILVTLSFSIVQVLYELIDVIQGFFIRPGGVPLSQKDLLFIGWDYDPFLGLRLLGDQNYEAAFTTLLFVKLTTFTYYVMLGILLVRKIILWFFIIISPLFPLLLFFYPLRNTAKIWLGEFFRWLLYAPLFAIFLAGVVSMWRLGIPLSFNFGSVNSASAVIFPTAVSILLGGPGQAVGQLNNLNIVDTYAQYIVALMMLWAVIIVPWILLQIFLDYLSDVNINSSPVLKQIAGALNKLPLNPPPGMPPPSPDKGGAGQARRIPLIKDFQIPTITNLAKQIPTASNVSVEQMTKLSVPTIRDIARLESQSITNSERTREEVRHVKETLTNIAEPSRIQNDVKRSEFEKIRETLRTQSLKGDKIASNILKASENYSQSSQSVTNETTNISTVINQLQNPQQVTNESEKEKIITLRERIEKESHDGNPLASKLSQSINPLVTTVNLTKALEKLVTPSKDIDTFERTEKLKENLQKESNEGNALATTILSSVTSLTEREKVTSSLIKILQPATVSHISERERYEQISQSLLSEKESGNQFATSLTEKLEKLKETTDINEKEKILSEIRESVVKENESNNPLAALILGQIEHLKDTKADTHISALSQELAKAQKEGNPLATELLSLSEKETLSETEVKDIEKKVEEAKRNGDPLGVLLSELLERRQKALLTSETPSTLPKTNRIQQVSLDDYEAVKKMWTENYENLDVPGEGDRKAWIQDDISQISETIDLLSSENAENVQKGMEKVSDILPFLLIGGFSQGEITAYLKAKMEAAKGVLTQMQKDTKDTEVLVEKKKTEEPKHLSQTVSVENIKEDATPDIHINVESKPQVTVRPQTVTISSPVQANESIVRMANLTIPTLKNIAQYEKMQLVGDEKQNQDIRLMKETLQGIADPQATVQADKKQYYQDIRSRLLAERKSGNKLADSLLTSAQLVFDKKLKREIEQFVTLSLLLKKLSEHDNMYGKLLTRITYESSNGSEFARTLEKAFSNPQLFSDPLQLVALIKEIIEHEKSDTLAEELLTLSTAQTSKSIEEEKQKLLSLQVFLQELSDPTFLPPEKQEKLSEVRRELEEKKSVSGIQDFLRILQQTSENGVDLSSIIKIDKILSEHKKEIDLEMPHLASFINLNKPQSIQHVLQSVVSEKPTSKNEEEVHKVIESHTEDPFVKKLRQWGQSLSNKEVGDIKEVLQGISDPDSVSENKRQEYVGLKEALEKSEATDTFSRGLLTLSHDIASKNISQEDLKSLLPTLFERAVIESLKGNPIASQLENIVYSKLEEEKDTSLFHKVLLSLSDPTHVKEEKRQRMLSLRSLIQNEISKGDSFARQVSQVVTQVVKKEVDGTADVLLALWQKTCEEQKKGNQIASSLVIFVTEEKESDYLFDLGEILKQLSEHSDMDIEGHALQALRKTLDDAVQKGDPQAMSILSAVEIIGKNGVDVSEVKKVADIIKNAQSTSYVQGLKVLSQTSLFSHGTLSLIKEILIGMGRNDIRFDQLSKAVELMHDTELWEILHESQKELTEVSDPQKGQEMLMRVRDSLLTESTNGNKTAQLFINTITSLKDEMKTQLFVRLLQNLANPEGVQLPEEKEAVEKLKVAITDSSDEFSQLVQSLLQLFQGHQGENDISHVKVLVQEYVVSQAKQGNTLASELVSNFHLETISEEDVTSQIKKEAESGNPVAKTLLTLISAQKQESVDVVLPGTNQTQQVSLEDYESVKHMWLEGYKSLDVPGINTTRQTWLDSEIQAISQTIALLTSENEKDQEEGTKRVSHILPFLLIGGFSAVEVVSYLKAKLEAAKTVRDQLKEKNDDEDTSLPQGKVTQEKKQNEQKVSLE